MTFENKTSEELITVTEVFEKHFEALDRELEEVTGVHIPEIWGLKPLAKFFSTALLHK